VLVFALLAGTHTAFRRGPDDANWELRWRSLDDLDRAWIAAAVVSCSKETRAALAERGQDQLAKGYSRRLWRRRAYVELGTLPLLIALLVLVLTGTFPHSIFTFIFSLWAFLHAAVYYVRDWRIKRKYRAAQDAELALAR